MEISLLGNCYQVHEIAVARYLAIATMFVVIDGGRGEGVGGLVHHGIVNNSNNSYIACVECVVHGNSKHIRKSV